MKKKEITSIYHLHVCKTGGKWINDNILRVIFNQCKKNNILVHKSSGKNKHLGWIPELDYRTFIIAGLREPVAQICSLWCSNNNELTLDKIDKEFFMQNIFSEEGISLLKNNQSKHFFYSNGIKQWGMGMNDSGHDYEEICMERLESVDYFYIMDKEGFNQKLLYSDICKKIGLENRSRILKIFRDHPKSEISHKLYSLLSDDEKQKIVQNLANIDIKLYNRAIEKSRIHV